jgi:hypothetical protein
MKFTHGIGPLPVFVSIYARGKADITAGRSHPNAKKEPLVTEAADNKYGIGGLSIRRVCGKNNCASRTGLAV